MTSADTNLFLYASNPSSPFHAAAKSFFDEVTAQKIPFAICELVLMEVYMGLRNPSVSPRPLSAIRAADYCEQLRTVHSWHWIDSHPSIREEVWNRARRNDQGFRRIIDNRVGLTLRFHGVTHFATANMKHFSDFGFTRVWNPVHPTP